MRVVGTISSKDHLCNYCGKDFATCPSATHLKFGDGLGNDNVVECSEYILKYIFGVYPIIAKPELGIFKAGEPKG